MIYLIIQFRKIHWSFAFIFLLPYSILGENRSWTGSGGDANWANPMNWSGSILPGAMDDVILDNRDMPISYQVLLPDSAVIIRSLHIQPSPDKNIELILPESNKIANGFVVTGPGYGIELDAGAIFRNASGIASGESISIADSLIIHNGARYVHQTRASHANSLLRILSIAPDTEQGIFDFDVPRASYTISVSNRVYGCLELHASALGSAVNYTCSGANPLHVRGNLRIGQLVNMSMNLSGSNGNMQIDGNFIQEGGQLNLASGTGSQTVLRIKGNVSQSLSAVITETANGNPYFELNGIEQQEIAMEGKMLNQVGFRVNNPAGVILRLPLQIPWILNLLEGAVTSSASAMLIIDTGCRIIIDSSLQTGTYVDGPIRKLGLNAGDYFLFPVGKTGNLRWLALYGAKGDFTVEYIRNNPAILGSNLTPGLDHISKLEYWTVTGSGQGNVNAQIELSFASALCGGITDPQYLNVAKFQATEWEDAGHSSITGDAIQGSVISGPTDFEADAYTLASTANLENPLPTTSIDLTIKEMHGETLYSWVFEGPEIPDHFNLYEEDNHGSSSVARISGTSNNANYQWIGPVLKDGNHFFHLTMTDVHGAEYFGKTVLFAKTTDQMHISWIQSDSHQRDNMLSIEVNEPEQCQYEIFTINGAAVKKGFLNLYPGRNYFQIIPDTLSEGIYVIRVVNATDEKHALIFRKN